MAFPVTCVAKSAPAAMAHPLTAAKSSATTATDVGSCPLSTNSLSVISFAAALSTSARYATRREYESIAADAPRTPRPTQMCSNAVGCHALCTPCATLTPLPMKNTPTALMSDHTNRSLLYP